MNKLFIIIVSIAFIIPLYPMQKPKDTMEKVTQNSEKMLTATAQCPSCRTWQTFKMLPDFRHMDVSVPCNSCHYWISNDFLEFQEGSEDQQSLCSII